MKRHLIIAIAAATVLAGFMSAGAAAQTITAADDFAAEPVVVVSRAGKVLFVDGKRLSSEETFDFVSERCGLLYAQRWSNSARIYSVGKGLLISSAVTIPVGVVGCVFGTALIVGGGLAGGIGAALSAGLGGDPSLTPENERLINGGAALFICGATLASVGFSTLIAGAVCVPVGKSRMNDIVGRCNSASRGPQMTMNFGSCPHGVGMTLNF